MRDCSTMAAFMLIFNSRCYVQGDKSTLDMRDPADLSLRLGCPPRRLKAPCLVCAWCSLCRPRGAVGWRWMRSGVEWAPSVPPHGGSRGLTLEHPLLSES